MFCFARQCLTLSHPRVSHPNGVRAVASAGIKRVCDWVLVNSGGRRRRIGTWGEMTHGDSYGEVLASGRRRIHKCELVLLCQGVKRDTRCSTQTGSQDPCTCAGLRGVTLFACHLFTPLGNSLVGLNYGTGEFI